MYIRLANITLAHARQEIDCDDCSVNRLTLPAYSTRTQTDTRLSEKSTFFSSSFLLPPPPPPSINRPKVGQPLTACCLVLPAISPASLPSSFHSRPGFARHPPGRRRRRKEPKAAKPPRRDSQVREGKGGREEKRTEAAGEPSMCTYVGSSKPEDGQKKITDKCPSPTKII